MFLQKKQKFVEGWDSSTIHFGNPQEIFKTCVIQIQYIIHIINYEELLRYPSVEGNFV